MNKDKIKNIALILINIFIVISTIIVIYNGVTQGASSGQLGEDMIGLGYFKAFTIDSNILSGLCSLLITIYLIKNTFFNKKTNIYKIALFELIGGTSVVLTFFIVFLFLIPQQILLKNDYTLMFTNDMLYFHVINPILAGITFISLKDNYKFTRKENIIALIPTAIYSVIYFLMVVILKLWPDFYGFTFGGKYFLIPFVFIISYTFTYLIAKGLIYLHNKNQTLN